MLEQLFGSKTRTRLLRIFFNNADQQYYLRELARMLRMQLNSVRREIENLENLGIVKPLNISAIAKKNTHKKKTAKTAITKSKKKYYILNSDYVLCPELKALMMKAELLVERRLINKIKKISKPRYLILTGYFVGLEDCSTDLLLVGSVNRNKFSRVIKRYEKEINHAINYTIMSLSEYRYRKDITDKFLYDILEEKKVVIVDKINKDVLL